MKRVILFLVVLVSVAGLIFATGSRDSGSQAAGNPVEITIYYADNPTLPFRQDWLAVQKASELANVKVNWEVMPVQDFNTKVSLALNTGVNAPDVILGQSISGENASLAVNGAILPISDYSNWTPNFNARVAEFKMQADVDALKQKNGKRYSLPSLTDVPFYDGGLLLRQDVLAKYNLPAPKTFDDLYNILRRYKQDNPSSYPMTVLVGPRVHYRFTQPSWGISVHQNGSGGSRVLSYDYDKNTFFAGAISDQYREYMRYWHKLYAEGLYDREYAEPISSDVWARKLATGNAIATYAYYDQIAGVEAASTIAGFKLQMYPPLAGPAGAHTFQKNKTGDGIIFPIGVSKRPDFEQVIRAVDKMFFSEEAAKIWCLGVEGVTYTMQGNTVKWAPSVPLDNIYKHIQTTYGCGAAGTQLVWVNAREMTKYDANYGEINKQVSAMNNATQTIPPTPRWSTDAIAERAASLTGTLFNTFIVWDDAFLTGAKSLDTDWNAYVTEMTSRGINELLNLYNTNR